MGVSPPRFAARVCAASTAALLLVGCPTRDLSRTEVEQCGEAYRDIPVEANRDLDLLFVIDNSGSMAEEQESLALNFDRFVNILEHIEGGLPSIHLGVISTDLGAGPYNIEGCVSGGDSGALQSVPRGDCVPPAGAFIHDIALADGTRQKNYEGSLSEAFSCIARLGTQGCGYEQPLEAMRRALDGSNPLNQDFLRPNAFLMVVFITDEDDCSTRDSAMFDPSQTSAADPLGPASSFRCFEFGVECEPDLPREPGARESCAPRADSQYMYAVDDYVAFLKGVKDDPSMVIVAGIIGNPKPVVVGVDEHGNPDLQPSCETLSGEADPGVRLGYFLNQFPQRNTVTTICNEDLSEALAIIAEPLCRIVAAPCLHGDLDSAPDTPGVQYDCQASDVRFPGEDRQEETMLQHCASLPPEPGGLPCWYLEEDVEACPDTITHLTVVVERGPVTIPPGTHTVVRCRMGC